MKRVFAFICVLALLLCAGCRTSEYALENIAGEYFFYFDKGDIFEDIPSITLHPDSTFEYVVPGLGGPYYSTGVWRTAPRGIRLSTRYTCIGANVDHIGLCEDKDSIDVYFSFLESREVPKQIIINENTFILDSTNHLRTTADELNECEYITDGFEFYSLCVHCQIVDGNQYTVTIVDNPYYPIIDNELWTISKDGTLNYRTNTIICKFRKSRK